MKKILSLVMAVVMLFSLSAIAFAADEKPVTVHFVIDNEVVKTITVDYGEDYNSQAPDIRREISGGIKYEFGGWECDHKYYSGTIYESLPVIDEDVPVYELTFTATYVETEYDGEEIVKDIIGDDATMNLKALWDEFVKFIQTIILYFAAFFGGSMA